MVVEESYMAEAGEVCLVAVAAVVKVAMGEGWEAMVVTTTSPAGSYRPR